LAFQPYSSNTVLFDLLINPATKAVFDKDVPEFGQLAQKVPPAF